ncbi:MAG: hypothetical protein GY861_12315 [bacterium]|nr:hypothetical protein [bacterium]
MYNYDAAVSRNIGILTPEAQDIIKNSSVAVAGAGGVGGVYIEQIVRTGIANIKIADQDIFEISNLNRQAGALYSTLGRNKTEVMCERAKDINPNVNIEAYPEGVTLENVAEFVSGTDVVADLVDYFSPEARLALHKAARENKQYVISTPSTGFGTLVLCFDPNGKTIEDLFEFPDDPEQIKNHHMNPKKLIGCDMAYIPDLYMQKAEEGTISTIAPAVTLAGAGAAAQTVKLLLYLEQQKDPDKFREYDQIEISTIPHAFRIDLWDAAHCLDVNLDEI